ncbi:type II secretion system protein GspE [Candidatus Dependentiae bacterium]|nr:MAG: type II secretion system protein GspE [Candidatus Dependentiae bacterium]
MIRKDIGDFLVESGVINTQQLHECQKEIKETGQPLTECLLDREFIIPYDLAKSLAAYASLDFIEAITDKMADITLLAKVPLHFLRDNVIMPVKIGDQITLLVANPLNFQPIDELDMLLGGGTRHAVAPSKIIIDAINRYYPLEGTKEMIEELEEEEREIPAVEFEEIAEKDILAMATEAPIIKLVNHILFQAVKRDASDIHIEPFEKELSVRYRIDGVLYEIMKPPKRIQGALVSRLKIMAHLNIAEKRMSQDGRIDIRVAGKAIDIRVSILPVVFGERVVMRLLDKSRTFAKFEELNMSERDYKLLIEDIHRTNGIIYVTGPTGSGKTTTLYSILSTLNKPEVNIITVEDPVEYQMPGIGQVQVREKIGLTFATALRSILRQDPDILMIGETRDQETAQIAVQSALTGHLVLSTLHTNNAPASITRLLDMGVEPYLIASSVILIIAQRLVRKLCNNCRKSYKPSKEVLMSIGLTEKEAKSITFYQPVGCEECNNTGYKGRLAIFELMRMTGEIAKLTVDRADTSLLRKQAIADGMKLLVQDGLRKIKEGLTTIDEVLSVATIEQEVVE